MRATLERVGGLLYRVGMRHENGNTSVVAYAAGPARIVVGELAASVADVLVARAQRPASIDHRSANPYPDLPEHSRRNHVAIPA